MKLAAEGVQCMGNYCRTPCNDPARYLAWVMAAKLCGALPRHCRDVSGGRYGGTAGECKGIQSKTNLERSGML